MLENFLRSHSASLLSPPIPSYYVWHFSITCFILAFPNVMTTSFFVLFALLVPTSNLFSLIKICQFQSYPFLKLSASCVLRKAWGLISIFTKPDFMGIHLCDFVYQCFITFYGGSTALCGHKNKFYYLPI